MSLWGFYLFFLLFRIAPAAYGGSQVRGRTEATAVGLCHNHTAMQDPSHVCDLHHNSRQRWIHNPLSEARDQSCNLMVASWICFYTATKGTSFYLDIHTHTHTHTHTFLIICGIQEEVQVNLNNSLYLSGMIIVNLHLAVRLEFF